MSENPNQYKLPSLPSSTGERSYLLKMRQFRNDGGPNPISFLGIRFLIKIVLVVAIMLWNLMGEEGSQILGWILVGYLVGIVTASLGTMVTLIRYWPIQNTITDWKIVDKRLEN